MNTLATVLYNYHSIEILCVLLGLILLQNQSIETHLIIQKNNNRGDS